MALTRAQYAAVAHRTLGDLASSLSTDISGDREEGDYSDALDQALRDCGFTLASEATTNAQMRAVQEGVLYYALRRLLFDETSKPTTQQGAGASGLHLMINAETAVRTLRMTLENQQETYEAALSAIGKSLSGDPSTTGSLAGWVYIDEGDAATEALVSGEHALPWFEEGYHEVSH